MTWRNLSLAVSAAGLLILVRSGGWLCAVGTPLSLATACLISNGHTRLSGLSMWCPLWSNDNPRTTPSFPRMCRATFPFFNYPRFLLSPTFNTISLISGTFGVLRVIRWVSIRLWIYKCLHHFQARFLASLSRLFSAQNHFAPTSKCFELKLVPTLHRCQSRLKAGCSNSSRRW